MISKPTTAPQREIYLLRIERFVPSYSFTLISDTDIPGAYEDHAVLEITGKFLLPRSLADSFCKVRLVGSRVLNLQLNSPDYIDAKVGRVGQLWGGPEGYTYRGSFAQDMLFQIAALLAQERMKLIELKGDSLGAKGANIEELNFRLQSEYLGG
jgi:hypothetical protein